MRFILILLSIFSLKSFAETKGYCFIVGNLDGTSYYASKKYKPIPDGISSETFKIILNDKKSALIPNYGLECIQSGVTGLTCLGKNGTVEVWNLNLLDMKIQYTQNRIAGKYYTSAKVFIGDIIRRCDD